MTAGNPQSAPAPGFGDLFTPKLVTVLKEGYGLEQLRKDAAAGLTVAVVALPLSMAIAIASGAKPEQGLYTAIIGGFIISALGGSRFQIGGPAGAFIVLVASIVAQHGMDGLALATMMAGVMMAAAGFFRLGAYLKFIPYPVTVGFTAGIAVIIFASQLRDLFGLELSGAEPGPLVDKLPALWAARATLNPATLAVAAASVVLIAALRKWRPSWPGMLIAVVAGAGAAALFNLPIETIGDRFGAVPSSLPMPSLPAISVARMIELLPAAFSIALLGSIESLLSAVVADGMTGRRHRSNCELAAQGTANLIAPLFGGICVTGTIARTATNVRAGAHGPVAGMLHALFLLVFILVAAPLAGFIPLASLAAVLVFVSWNMIEREAMVALARSSRGDMVILATTLLLTIFRDLTEAIVAGVALGSLLFIHRLSTATMISAAPLAPEDIADSEAPRAPFDPGASKDPDIAVYRIAGAFFFAAAASAGAVLDNVAQSRKALIIDFSSVPLTDSTGARTIESLAHKLARRGVAVYVAGASDDVRRTLTANGVRPPLVAFAPTAAAASVAARAGIAKAADPAPAG